MNRFSFSEIAFLLGLLSGILISYGTTTKSKYKKIVLLAISLILIVLYVYWQIRLNLIFDNAIKVT